MIRPRPDVAAMASYALADLGDPTSISLAQNESAFPPSPKALEAGANALKQSALYPDPDWRDLRRSLASVHPVDADAILCGAGSMELIGCLIRAFSGQGDEVVGTQYGYLFVATAAQQANATYVQAEEPDLTVSVDSLLNKVSPATRIVFVCNPGNPTGTRIPNTEILRLRDELPQDILLVVDQAYAEFDDQDHAPIFGLVDQENTVVMRTLSKAYGLAGARVGWGVFPASVRDQVRKLLNPNNVSLVSQALAVGALADQAYMARTVSETARRRDAVSSRLRLAGYDVPNSATNFILIRFKDTEAAQRAEAALRANGLILRGMGGYGLSHCLRATIAAESAMERLAETLEHLA